MIKTLVRISPLLLLLCAFPALAMDWSAAGSTGILDPASVALATTSGGTLQFASGQTGTITARYPVVNTYGSATSKQPGWASIQAGFNAGGGTVTIKLYRQTECVATVTEICSISLSSSTLNQCRTCLISDTIDFNSYTYFIEVTLTRTSTSQDPRIYNLSLQ